jgi:hypothetical protein
VIGGSSVLLVQPKWQQQRFVIDIVAVAAVRKERRKQKCK